MVAKPSLAHECHFATPYPHFAAAKWAAKRYQEEPRQSTLPSASPPEQTARTSDHLLHTTMARTRGSKSSSLSTLLRSPRDTPVQGSISEPPRPRVVPPPVEDAPISPLPSVITREELSLEPESEPTPSSPPVKKSPPPAKKPQPSQTPTKESQIPSSMTPEVVIRRPMVTQPPIEGNLDYRARTFHSELCFDIATFRLQPELRDSFCLL
ncbi:hypothetical protein CK203_045858 [Vitis vinifera]|uniref:Uncharacterized protein n=1 Tax=Vitis vinifera TaxID=29760 RepID=A0A438FM50_VITVI|nr:hypothetical protein CK203_045858 [Vitis vinifera]